MLVTFLLVIVFPVICWLLHWHYKTRHYEKYLKKIPGPTPLPLVGNALEIKSSTAVLPQLMKYMNEFRGSFKLYIGSQPYFFICETKDLEFLLSSTTIIRKSDVYGYLHRWLGLGLLTSWGTKWRKHRKIITPAFHFQILEEFVEVFDSAGDILVSKLKARSGEGPIDIYPFITRCALDIICETAMGTSVNAQDDVESEYVKSMNMLLEMLTIRAFSSILSNDYLYLFSKTFRRERRALKVVHDYSKSVINKRKAEFFTDAKSREASIDTLGRKKKRAFLDLLLECSLKDPSFTDDDIRQEVDTFIFEGHDTTATSMTFAFYALTENPDVQKKTYAELQAIFSDDPKRGATLRDLQEMKYLEMVIKESLRIYTTIPMFGRTLENDVTWNGVLLPKGLMVNVFSYGVHNNPEIYENPEIFDPDRFNAENTQGRNPFASVPFSAGPRNCVGQKFAMLEMKATISKVLRQFELFPAVPAHKIILKGEAVLKSDNGVFIQLKPRN